MTVPIKFLTVSCDASATAKPPIEAPAITVTGSIPKRVNNFKKPRNITIPVRKLSKMGTN